MPARGASTGRRAAPAVTAAGLAAALLLATAACDRGDGRQLAEPATPPTSASAPTGTAGDGTRTFDDGQGVIELDSGTRLVFDVDFCAEGPATGPGGDPLDIDLQIDGTGTTDAGEPFAFNAVRTSPGEQADVITETIRISFGSGVGLPDRAWEAQRVIDPGTGEVTDQHGDATTPLFEITETASEAGDGGTELRVVATDATFWQFDFGAAGETMAEQPPPPGDTAEAATGDGPVGLGDVRVACR